VAEGEPVCDATVRECGAEYAAGDLVVVILATCRAVEGEGDGTGGGGRARGCAQIERHDDDATAAVAEPVKQVPFVDDDPQLSDVDKRTSVVVVDRGASPP